MSKLLEKCKYVNKYKGLRPPRCGCLQCWTWYVQEERQRGKEEGYYEGYEEGTARVLRDRSAND